MRFATMAFVGFCLASSCGGVEEPAQNERLLRPSPPGSTQASTAPHAVQLFLRYERDQHDLVRVAPGPCG